MTAPIYPQMPEHSLVVLIGPSGAGKTTLANTWPASQVLSLDALREVVSNDAGDQDTTGDAVAALQLLLEARMRRRLFTVVDATNVTKSAREPLVAATKRHDMLPIAVMVATPGSVCIERQGPRPANRAVPKEVVAQQHEDMFYSCQKLKGDLPCAMGKLGPSACHRFHDRQDAVGGSGVAPAACADCGGVAGPGDEPAAQGCPRARRGLPIGVAPGAQRLSEPLGWCAEPGEAPLATAVTGPAEHLPGVLCLGRRRGDPLRTAGKHFM